MAPLMLNFDEAKSRLVSMGVTPKEAWLHACMEAFQKENDKSLPSFSEYVYSQALVSCMSTYNGKSVLPTQLQSQSMIHIQAPIFLELLDWYDVSTSLHGQLNENEEYKKAGIYKITVTDGIQDFVCMTYEPLSFLHDNLPLGSKISVSNVEIRRGVLYLTPQNTRLLGGCTQSEPQEQLVVRRLQRLLKKNDVSNELKKENRPSSTPTEPRPIHASMPPIQVSSKAETQSTHQRVPSVNFISPPNQKSLPPTRISGAKPQKHDVLSISSSTIPQPSHYAAVEYSTDTSDISFSLFADDDEIVQIPLESLSEIMNKSHVKKARVKAYLVTLLSKLKFDGDEFGLDALINDGTSTMRVSLSSQVIEMCFGLTYKEYKTNLQNDQGKIRNAQAGKLAEERLRKMNGIMTIERLHEPNFMPLITLVDPTAFSNV